MNVAEAERDLPKILHYFQKIWLDGGKNNFINGMEPTIADFSAYSELSQLFLLKYDFSKTEHIKRWMLRMESLKGYKEGNFMLTRALSRL
eukprot:gene21132-25386_t